MGGESKILSPKIQPFSCMTLNLIKFEKLYPEILEDAFFAVFQEASIAKLHPLVLQKMHAL